jgi:sortase A
VTTILDPEQPSVPTDVRSAAPVTQTDPDWSASSPSALTASTVVRRRPGVLVAIWVGVVLACLGLVLYGLEPLFQARQQTALLTSYTAAIDKATKEAEGLAGVSVPTKAPEPGASVGILEIGSIKVQQVVVEGATPTQTDAGPGHVSGTAGPGQPGNSVIVGRRSMYGGPFGDIGRLQAGDQILVTTVQGQVVYEVDTVEKMVITHASSSATPTQKLDTAATADSVDADHRIDAEQLFGPTDADQLTLVTSASRLPTNSTEATIVVAKMKGKPFAPTPQGGRTDDQTSLSGQSAAWRRWSS